MVTDFGTQILKILEILIGGGIFEIWNADDTDLLWQNADDDGFAKAKADGYGF
ncbi:hypothetical protein FLCU109888_07515 [Flavobacterium cucumis]|uniref:Uncharacterized protein n=1 Tax=Flavobacterium cucumis TaxID=416016 RepID=A0A1M7ZWF5_9FLAO|nr:hypothetical protein [Flavobacterium cucumis]SHO73221.1 hypothetical protein SAMN05443547_1576 [Flavobacterium cucumis]